MFFCSLYLINPGRVKLEKQKVEVIRGAGDKITISVASTTTHEAILTGKIMHIKNIINLQLEQPHFLVLFSIQIKTILLKIKKKHFFSLKKQENLKSKVKKELK